MLCDLWLCGVCVVGSRRMICVYMFHSYSVCIFWCVCFIHGGREIAWVCVCIIHIADVAVSECK